jgi:hypothetical protein
VRIFDEGEIVSEIIPEIWLLRRYGTHLINADTQRGEDNITVVSKRE